MNEQSFGEGKRPTIFQRLKDTPSRTRTLVALGVGASIVLTAITWDSQKNSLVNEDRQQNLDEIEVVLNCTVDSIADTRHPTRFLADLELIGVEVDHCDETHDVDISTTRRNLLSIKARDEIANLIPTIRA